MDKKIIIFALLFLSLSCRENRVKKAERFLKEGRVEEAQFLLESHVRKNEMDSRAIFLLGEVYLTKGEYYKAIYTFRKIPQKDLYKDELINDLKYIFDKTKYSAQEIAYNSAELITIISPDYYEKEIYMFLGEKYVKKGKMIEAENVFKKIWEREKNYESLLNLLNLLEEENSYSEIIELKDSIPEEYLTDEVNAIIGGAFFEIGKIYYEREKADSALFYIEKFMQVKKPLIKLAEAYYIKAEIMLLKGDTLSAVQNFYNVIKLNPARETGLPQKARKRIKELKK